MGSSYTDNNKLEKIGTGEQAGTWGTTTNLNFDMIDRAINGVKTITLTGSSSSLTTSDGTLTDGLFKVLQFIGSLSSLHTITISPNDVEKLYFINNNCGASVKFTQGSGGDVTIENAKTAIIFCDGAGSSAKVTKIETGSESFTEDLTVKTGDGALLTLQTSDTTITDGDVLGALQFQAPDDTDGKTGDADGSKVTASIVGEADATFNADTNSTDLVFKLATDGDAAEKMRLAHEGVLSIPADGSETTNGIHLGAGSDLKIYHDGSNSFIDENGTGDLFIRSNTVHIKGYSVNETILKGIVNGAVELYHDNSKKLETTASGATISGVVTATGFTIGSAVIAESELEQIDGITAGTASASKALVVDGSKNISSIGTLSASEVTATSDERLKSDIKTIDNALDKVMNMRGVSFTKQAERGIGVIAQEVEKIIPEVVTDGEYKSVAYGNMVGVLIEAIKEQQKQIDELKKDKYGSSD